MRLRRHAAAPGEERYRAAKQLLAGAERNQRRLGLRWSDQDLERFAAEDRELLKRSRDPADHAHRAGYERAQFESLRGPEREHAEAAIEKARRRDLKRVEVASEPPGRIIGRGRLAAERVRQGVEGARWRTPPAVAGAAPRTPPRSAALAAQPQPRGLGAGLDARPGAWRCFAGLHWRWSVAR